MSIAYLFPGQGSQHVGMGQDLYDQSSAARAVFDQADEQLGFALSKLCFEGPIEELTDTVNQQPALFVTSIAALQVMESLEWEAPAFVAGHSLGELSALVAAGAVSFSDGLALVRRRGELMKEAGEREPGAMAAILALQVEDVVAVCAQAQEETDSPIQLANDNCPGQLVISGDATALDRAMALAKEAGARKVVKLPISIAAHSPLMASASAAFGVAVDETPITEAAIPVIANVTGQPIITPDEIRAELKAQLTSSVNWTASMSYLIGEGVDTVVEVGSGEVLIGLMKRINRKTKRIKFKIGE